MKNGLKISNNCKNQSNDDDKKYERISIIEISSISSRLILKIQRKKHNKKEKNDSKMKIKDIPQKLPKEKEECSDDEFIITIPQQSVKEELPDSDDEFIITLPPKIPRYDNL